MLGCGKQIPADMVVNAMLVAMVAHANQPCDIIYHVGSSVANPIKYLNLKDYGFKYFTAKPCLNKEGKPIKVGNVAVLDNITSFHRYMFIRYLLPLKVISNPQSITTLEHSFIYAILHNYKNQKSAYLINLHFNRGSS